MARKKSRGLCPSCPKRAECREPCGALEAELSRQCGYQRELPVSVDILERLAEKGLEISGEAAGAGEERPELSRREVKIWLTPRQAQVLELVIWEGLSLSQTAKRLRIHRSAALRRYRNALLRLRAARSQAHSAGD